VSPFFDSQGEMNKFVPEVEKFWFKNAESEIESKHELRTRSLSQNIRLWGPIISPLKSESDASVQRIAIY